MPGYLDRYGEPVEDDDEQLELHDSRCEAGWLGEDDAGLPVPCVQCHPTLPVRCAVCTATAAACASRRALSGRRCCDACNGHPNPRFGGHP